MRKRILACIAMGAAAAIAGGAGAASAQQHAVPEQMGEATWYGEDFDGRITASGERFDMYALTAADSAMPFGAVVEVTDLENGRSVDVRITDRPQPGAEGVIVLSKAAAANLGFAREHSAHVQVRLVGMPRPGGASLSLASSR